MPYKYNPLLKLDLQKQQDVPEPPEPTYDDALSDTSENAVQNRIITEEITKISDTQTKKVSKFHSSIEDLEIGEIGEYQGESNENFSCGFFYKRQNAGFSPVYSALPSVKLWLTQSIGYYGKSAYTPLAYGTLPSQSLSEFNGFTFYVECNCQSLDCSFHLFLLPLDSVFSSPYRVDNFPFFNESGYLVPTCFVGSINGSYNPSNPVKCLIIEKNGVYFIQYNGNLLEISAGNLTLFGAMAGYNATLYSNFYVEDDKGRFVQFEYYLLNPNGGAFVFPLSKEYDVIEMARASMNPNLSYWTDIEIETVVYQVSWLRLLENPRVNTQPPYQSQTLSLTTDSAGNVDTNFTLADIVPLCAYDTNNDVRLMLSVNNAQHIIITPASYSDATTRYPETSFSCVLFYIEVPTA